VEPAANQLLRDFRRRSIFDFCNTIPLKADIADVAHQVRFVPKVAVGTSPSLARPA
jgi:hypothetical protein